MSSFRVAGYVFSRGVISSFRMAFFRPFVFSHGVYTSFYVASFRREKTNWHNPATKQTRICTLFYSKSSTGMKTMEIRRFGNQRYHLSFNNVCDLTILKC